MNPSHRLTVRRPILGATVLSVLLLLWLVSVPAHAQIRAEPWTLTGPANLGVAANLVQCTVASQQTDRSTTFAGQMTSISMTQKMMMRIDVQERTSGESSFHTISAPGLGVWRSSETGVKIYKYFKQVTNLPAPGEFRGLITFRWLAGKGHLLRQTIRHTQSCAQPDERPKLVVGQVLATPAPEPSTATYQIALHNDGRSSSGAFTVLLSVNGVAQPPLSASSLAAGASTVLVASAPACTAGSTLIITPDPQHQVEEAQGGGLTEEVPCPLPQGTTSGPTGSG